MDAKLQLIFFYAQPVVIPLLLLASKLVLFREQKIEHEHEWRARTHTTIWWLQALISTNFLLAAILGAVSAAASIEKTTPWPILQAEMSCDVGLFLYFGAGLLPDPDSPFKPCKSNFHTWILAVIFELTYMLTVNIRSSIRSQLEWSEFVLSGVRILILLSMITIFVLPTLNRPARHDLGNSERDALLQHDHTIDVSQRDKAMPRPTDAQSTGWLEYFVGFSALLPYIWPSGSPKYQAVMVFCFALLVCQRAVNILVPFQLGALVSALGEGQIPYAEIGLYCLYRSLQGQQGILNSTRAILWIPISQLLYRQLSCDAYEHILLLSLDFHLSKRIGEVMAALSKGGSLNTFLDGFAFQLFPMVFDLGVAAVYLFIYYDVSYSIVVVGVMWTYIFVTIYMAKYRGRARREMAKRDREMESAKTDALIAYETVHHHCAVPLEITKFRSLVEYFQKAEFSVLFSLNGLNAMQNFVFIFGIVLVCLLSAYQISIGEQRVSDFVALITYFAQLQAPLAFFGSFYNQVQNNLIDAERMLDLFKHKSDVVDLPGSKFLQYCRGEVRFEDVSFSYATGKVALKNVSFQVKSGATTAIVGESGSGKSTILKLLYRFYDPVKGHILFDDLDIHEITIDSLRSHIGVVPQDTVLFNDSILYNMRYAKPDASDREIHDACTAASIHHRIQGFPEGYETRVGERGLKLSGGEKQRISIARAILKDPQIMLLDEATASLDTHTEKQIQVALENVTKGRTTITIAHRLSTITQADQIIVLHEGCIEERGTHSELLRLDGRYRAMWDKQTIAETT